MTVIILQILCMRKVCSHARQKFPFSFCSMRDEMERSLSPLTKLQKEKKTFVWQGISLQVLVWIFLIGDIESLNAKEKQTHLSSAVICIAVFPCHFFQSFL